MVHLRIKSPPPRKSGMATVMPCGLDVSVVAVLDDGTEIPIAASEVDISIRLDRTVDARVLMRGVELDLDGIRVPKAPPDDAPGRPADESGDAPSEAQ